MRKRKGIYGALLCAVLTTMLAGCGDGSEESGANASAGVAVVSAEPVPSEAEREIINYELKYNKGEFTMEDYHALAELYAQTGRIRRQRDMLEQSYRLYNDFQALELLQTLAVNLGEEDLPVQNEARTMLQSLELPEYLGEAVHMIGSGEWMQTMMPKLYEGQRNYFLTKDGVIVLSIQAGYDTEGIPFSNVWYNGADNQVTFLGRKGNTVQLMNTGLAEGAYDGAFDIWTLNSANSDIYREQGSFAGGLFAGGYTAEIHTGEAEGDFFDLWSSREGMEYAAYTGSFDGEGKATVEQPSDSEAGVLLEGSGSAGLVVYAYGQDNGDCLFLELEEGVEASDYRFGAQTIGVDAYPAFSVYETIIPEAAQTLPEGTASPDTTASPDEAGIQVRIYDGEVQYLDGGVWVSAGSVQSLMKEDPFRTYRQEREAGMSGGGADGNDDNDRFGRGSITQVTPTPSPAIQKPTTTPKPAATQKPTATQKPVVNKPAATPAPTQPPVQEPDDDDDDNGGGSSDSGSGGNGGGSDNGSGGSDGGSGGGNSGDVDIEWTDDIL